MRVIVLGCGRVGAGLSSALTAAGHEVTVVDLDGSVFRRLGPTFSGRRITGSALDRGVMEAAGLDRADALAAVTGSDEVNAIASRLAVRRFRVPRVVARIYDPGKASLYRRLGVQTVSQLEWGTRRIFELVTSAHVGAATALGAGQVELVDVPIPPALEGKPITEIEVPSEVRVMALTRAGRTFLPDPPVRFGPGDRAHVAVAAGAMDRLERLLGG